MPAMRMHDRSTANIPHLHEFVITGCYARAVGRPRQSLDRHGMPAIDEELTTGSGVPYLHGATVPSRCDTPAIGRPRDCLHAVPVAAIGNNAKAVRGIPDTHALIIAGRNDLRPPWRPGNRRYTTA